MQLETKQNKLPKPAPCATH